jgi:ribosomal protein S18 acetylase RimI-like enzyme
MRNKEKQLETHITKAQASDHHELTLLTQKSKNFWAYGAKQIEVWAQELTITGPYIDENQVYKLMLKQQIIGYYSYYQSNNTQVKLDNLFVLPECIGKHHGSRLLEDFIARIIKAGYQQITLDADPHAENFYLKQGFIVIGQLKTSIEGRYLPIMVKDLSSVR